MTCQPGTVVWKSSASAWYDGVSGEPSVGGPIVQYTCGGFNVKS